ncbi:MAG: LysM peptidoglycan-binding domain-containing protein [Culturomica sp.]|nr:LysM peptidoglycan-binding domain-containing protein [Culturomica sp.]
MKNYLLLLSLLLYFAVWADNNPIKKSSEIAVIHGESFYLHTVEAGQTLFSIAKAYNVTVDLIKDVNGLNSNNLSINEILRIPYYKGITSDSNFYYHKTEKGETIYSIARRFDIRPKRILKENPKYEKSPLAIGDVVKLPLKDIDLKRAGVQLTKPLPEAIHNIEQTLISDEPTVSPVEFSVNINESNDSLSSISDLAVEADQNISDIIQEPNAPEKHVDTISKSKSLKIAVLLPFFAAENMHSNEPEIVVDSIGDITIINKVKHILPKSEQFISFYEGVLLGLDSLKRAGYELTVKVYDTQRDNINMYRITDDLNIFNPDLIIGPVYASELNVLMRNLENPKIPVVYPLSSRGEDFVDYPNFLQVNISYNSLVDRMTEWILSHKQDSARIFALDMYNNNTDYEQVRDRLTVNLEVDSNVKFVVWDSLVANQDTFRYEFSPKFENIIVLPTLKEADVNKMMPFLSAYTDRFKITVIGFPEWQNFNSGDHEAFYKLNTKFLTYSFVNPYAERAKWFQNYYNEFFFNTPSSLTYKAFDIITYLVPLTAIYREYTLDALLMTENEGEELFSTFDFKNIKVNGGLENKSLFIINYGSDYKIKRMPLRY